MKRVRRVFRSLWPVGVIALVVSCHGDKNPQTPITDTAPTACFSIQPTVGTTLTAFQFNTGCSQGAAQPAGDLRFRWDWEADGTWDTPFADSSSFHHRFATVGARSISMVVQEGGGLTSRVIHHLYVYDPSVDSLLDPGAPRVNRTAPDSFRVRFTTSRGVFVITAHRDWSPHGVDRFFNLAQSGYYNDDRFFRILSGFIVQFGINGDPEVNAAYHDATITDDPVKQSNTRGFVTFAQTGAPDSRSTQVFINLGDNRRLDGLGFAPFGKVTEGMEVVDSLYSGYGEGAPSGQGPEQSRIQSEGNQYLVDDFPRLDDVVTATVESDRK